MKKRFLSLALILILLFQGVQVLAATSYQVYSRIPVYGDSGSAAARVNPAGTYEAGTYFLYKTAVNGMLNISRADGVPGAWINPADNKASTTTTWQTRADVNFRTGPSSTYSIIQKLPKGTTVELIAKTTSTWYKIRYNNITGYVSAAYLVEGTGSTPTAPAPAPEPVPTAPAAVYSVNSKIPVYADAGSAAQRVNAVETYDPGTYYRYATTNGMHNISRTSGVSGRWINPLENRSVIGIWAINEAVNFRTGPSSAFPAITKLLTGTEVELLSKTSSSWYEIRYQGTTGFVAASYLTEVRASDPAAAPVYLETISNVNFRTGPAATTQLIQYLLAGSVVELVSKYSDTWYEVRYAGKVGYISAKYLKAHVEVVVVIPEDPAEPTMEITIVPYLSTTAVNLRTGPSTAYPIIKKLDLGTPMNFQSSSKDGWVQVSYSGQKGFISSAYITPLVKQSPVVTGTAIGTGTRTHVINARADIRTGPATSYTRLARLTPGALVGVVSINNSWAKVRYYETGVLKTGYVNTSFISPQVVTHNVIPRIGIAFNPSDLKYYVEAINRAGGEAILLPEATSAEHAAELAANVSGIVFAGGRSTSNSDRLMIQEALLKDKPTLGICLGFQLINAASGGNLTDLVTVDFVRSQIHRDPTIEAYFYHDINILPGTKLANLVGTGKDNVNSFHRYIVNTLGANLEVMAESPDGVVEGIERTDKTFVIGLASHPERLYSYGNTIYHSVFVELVNQARQLVVAPPIAE